MTPPAHTLGVVDTAKHVGGISGINSSCTYRVRW